MENKMKESEEFVIKNYGKQSTFASFLPGISGVRGIPIWCYYVNRGQGVVSFGVDNKDHAIMEFYPAHQAYQNVSTTGFRTFIRKDGKCFEVFTDMDQEQIMMITQNGLVIEEEDQLHHIHTKVTYFTLPGEKVGALVRKVELTNLEKNDVRIEVLDGMPALIPYGVGIDSMKNMGQTAKAWMQVEDVESKVPFYRVRASMDDTASVKKIEGGNFSFACLPDGELLDPIVDPEVIFSYDTSLKKPVNFMENGWSAVHTSKQKKQNLLPCSFYGVEKQMEAGETITVYELIGQVEKKEILLEFLEDKKDEHYFKAKKEEADALVEELCKGITTKTASKEFDAYCHYTYMDNVLRGGYPIQLGNNKIFYVYSRKHGDLERDYNYFSMLPEFYSQGNGNFRDVNQNRRCDTFFAPFVGRENIHEFYSLIQLDGYNPLGVEKITYNIEETRLKKLLANVKKELAEDIIAFLKKPFTPGALYQKLEDTLGQNWNDALFYQIIDFSESMVNGNFGEGYWCDHWTYNLDLVQDYLEINPEKEKEMLFEEVYTYFLGQMKVNRREKRYEETINGLRQYHALDETSKRTTKDKLVHSSYGKGEVLKGTLMEKLLLLCATKFATLDAYGMGIEMEGGKPGWYDALNGMPGMFGSSMAETYELCRMLNYTIQALEKYPENVQVIEELASLMDELTLINQLERDHIEKEEELISFWNRCNDAKEIYRDKTYDGVSGKHVNYESKRLVEMLSSWRETVQKGIEKACRYGNGICPTYFTFEVPDYEVLENGIKPKHFVVVPVPYFLEGPVRYLKLPHSEQEKKELYQNIRTSDLYDPKLDMYKVNASLQDASFELGRAKAFTPGWLENESIWLHMEYKYLLELLRAGMFQEFFHDFKNAAVPFLDAKTYGRSILENSSFIASSKNPNEDIHGKGFVARLSGSTIEFISMWKLMMFGSHVFTEERGELVFAPKPAIPDYLIPNDGSVRTTLLGNIQVEYQFDKKESYHPKNSTIKEMKLWYRNGSVANLDQPIATGKTAEDIRNGMVEKIVLNVKHL